MDKPKEIDSTMQIVGLINAKGDVREIEKILEAESQVELPDETNQEGRSTK